MKKQNSSTPYLFSALIALTVSLGVVGGQQYLSQDENNVPIVKTVKGVEGKNVLYTADKEGNITPLDFTDTSEKVLDAVVHIKATQSSPMGGGQDTPRELPDPFKQFFGDRFQMPERGMQQQPRVGSEVGS